MAEVIGFAGAAAAVALYGRLKKGDRQHAEVKAGVELYSKYFNQDLQELSTGQITTLAADLPSQLNSRAAASIRVIEAYQQKRKRWFLGLSSSSGNDFAGDIRTRILEEMKQWLITLAGSCVRASDVSARLQYCWQFLLRPSIFQTTNDQSFLGTLAQVCSQLDELLRQTIAEQHTGAEKLGRVLDLGRELAEATLPALLCVLPYVLPSGAGRLSTPYLASPASLHAALAEAEWAAQPRDGTALGALGQRAGPISRDDDVGCLLRTLVGTGHLRWLATGEAEAAGSCPPQGSSSSGSTAGGLPLVEETRAAWAAEAVGAGSGLGVSFRGPRHQRTRGAYLDLCHHFDRIVFFLGALQRYHDLASMAGDLAMCRLRDGLGHLLQEFEKALLLLRQSRLEVMRGAKMQLQTLAKDMPAAGTEGFTWMQGLRDVDESRMDSLHREIVALCIDIRVATTVVREAELSKEACKRLQDVASSFGSADFQSRCAPALRGGLVADAQDLARLPDVAKP